MSKFKKRGVIISSILIVFVALGVMLKPFVIEYIEDRIKSEVEKVEDFTARAIHISILDREIIFDSVTYKTLEKGIKLEITSIEVDGFSLYQLIFKKHLAIDKVVIAAPEYSKYALKNEKVEKNSQKHKLKLEQLSFKNIEVIDGNLQLFSIDSSLIHQVNQINSQLIGIDIDLTKPFIPSQIEYSGFNITMDSSCLFQNSKHFLTTKKVLINDLSGIIVKDLNYCPNKIYMNGSKKEQYRVNWTNATIDSLHLSLDWNLLQNKQQIHSDKLIINQLEYSSLINKNYPKKEHKEKLLPHQMIQQLNLSMTLDSILIINSRFEYNETKKGRNDRGVIYFTEFNATIENITNDSASLATNNQMKATIETKLMSQSVMAVIIDYNLASAEGNHRIHGNLANFDLTNLNKVFMPLALIRFEEGHLTKMDFNYYLNSTFSEGTLDFYYENLNISVFNDKKENNPQIIDKVISGLANSFIIRKSNPLRGHYIKGDIDFTREKDKSFLNFWWKSLFSGMKSSVIRSDLN
ncbi:MAG: hypothetical protein RJQ00_06970 [Vicingaceae bacterium]